jgi:peptide chain release factor 2
LSPGFWDDNARATSILKSIKENEFWISMYLRVSMAVEDFAVLFEFWKADEATESEAKEAFDKATTEIEEAEFKSTLNDPADSLPAVLQINSGAGGTESQDWAEILARMYRMYGEKQGWSVTELDWQWGDGAVAIDFFDY